MIKIFLNDKPIVFAVNFYDKNFILYSENPTPEQLISDFSNADVKGGCFISAEPEKSFEQFKSQFTLIEAAGGLVFNADNSLLLIQRLGKWDLPKGKTEKGESAEESALREVCEETGVCDIKFENHVADTYHIYRLKEKNILKTTRWYKMRSTADEHLSPQTEEDITQAKWMSKEEVHAAMSNTYGSIRELLLRHVSEE